MRSTAIRHRLMCKFPPWPHEGSRSLINCHSPDEWTDSTGVINSTYRCDHETTFGGTLEAPANHSPQPFEGTAPSIVTTDVLRQDFADHTYERKEPHGFREDLWHFQRFEGTTSRIVPPPPAHG